MEVTWPLGSLVTFAAPPWVCTARVVSGPRAAAVVDVPGRPDVVEEPRRLAVAALPRFVVDVGACPFVEEVVLRPLVVVEVPLRVCWVDCVPPRCAGGGAVFCVGTGRFAGGECFGAGGGGVDLWLVV